MKATKSLNIKSTSRISFTAHFTGHTWYAHGLSNKNFTTPLGYIFYNSLKPIRLISKNIFNFNELENGLLQRHIIINHLLEKSIAERGVKQILELACGLSPRGYTFMNKNKNSDIRYIEADLPGMANLKKEKLKKAGFTDERHLIIPCDILSESGELSVENIAKKYLNPDIPTAVITEGLVNYFDIEALLKIWKRISNVLTFSSGGVYLFDNLAHKTDHPYYPLIKIYSKLLSVVVRGTFKMHFCSDSEAGATFKGLGFRELNVHHSESYNDVLTIPLGRRPSLIDIIEAIV